MHRLARGRLVEWADLGYRGGHDHDSMREPGDLDGLAEDIAGWFSSGVGSDGALIAALLVGLVDTFGKVLFPSVASMLVYVLMALVLLFKPEGLFKQ